jgi:hypothetical protein
MEVDADEVSAQGIAHTENEGVDLHLGRALGAFVHRPHPITDEPSGSRWFRVVRSES